MLSFVRFMALLEGTSLLVLLLIAMPLKYHFDMPEAVKLIGPIHGVLFLAFNAVLFGYAAKGHLSGVKAVLGFFASLIPFGTFVYKYKVLK
ncbi:DUF3817 domain-containing protein [Thiosulfativibrio zosterae]|uniref:Putative membrane protein YdzA n=1 Tax=Thiosulfativibrio zosterae TaxID=2675053 RepID=A0A6F8PPH5_9GAMM|nr:DUF3817 domain-containing protein [Thiosulfativibrio zosterae]BBP44005.1 putative membrane protein YdzA [Thiosulfativibrio zosterae]